MCSPTCHMCMKKHGLFKCLSMDIMQEILRLYQIITSQNFMFKEWQVSVSLDDDDHRGRVNGFYFIFIFFQYGVCYLCINARNVTMLTKISTGCTENCYFDDPLCSTKPMTKKDLQHDDIFVIVYIDGLVQDCSISSVIAKEILQPCT